MAARVDLNGIKSEIKSILNTANTTTASLDLSASLAKRVQKVLSVHPEMINPQASFYPFVTCYIKEKPIISEDIAGRQSAAKRRSEINIEIVAAVNENRVTDVTDDAADTEINYLMENIEIILRDHPTLGGKVKWQKPESAQYYASFNNQTITRVAIMPIKALVFY